MAGVVSSHWSGQRGEFPVLHHSDGCVQLHYTRAAGSPSCRGRSADGLAPLAQGLRPRFTGQGLVRTQAWLLANGWSWSGVASRRMIYRHIGWRECQAATLQSDHHASPPSRALDFNSSVRGASFSSDFFEYILQFGCR